MNSIGKSVTSLFGPVLSGTPVQHVEGADRFQGATSPRTIDTFNLSDGRQVTRDFGANVMRIAVSARDRITDQYFTDAKGVVRSENHFTWTDNGRLSLKVSEYDMDEDGRVDRRVTTRLETGDYTRWSPHETTIEQDTDGNGSFDRTTVHNDSTWY